MKIQLRIEVPLCNYPPKGYGAAYEDWKKRRRVCYPFPLNWIVAITLKFWHRVRHTKYMVWDRPPDDRLFNALRQARSKLANADAHIKNIQVCNDPIWDNKKEAREEIKEVLEILKDF
ncbi:MAG: hypothetical protein KKH94_11495 [Candidatus Omnitrophica bacterium]|nr:hypothetical protein [Candidatus Omnitrophota bacterium]